MSRSARLLSRGWLRPRFDGTASPRFRERRSPWVWLGVVILCGWVAVRWLTYRGEFLEPLVEGDYQVVKVVDGDMLVLAKGARIRLMGVDTPETVRRNTPVQPFGPEASEFTRQFVSHGSVRLQFDQERYDRFGRWLGYVWVGDQLLNEQLLLAGLARWEPQFHYSAAMKTRFRRAEQAAQNAGRGLWSAAANDPPP